MTEVKFDHHYVASRKDLLHFVEGLLKDKDELYKGIGKDFDTWRDELDIIHGFLTGRGLVGGIGINLPPVDDPDFEQLGEDIFLYRGKQQRLRGLWKRKTLDKVIAEETGRSEEWEHFRMGTSAELRVNHEFSAIPIENFLPENFAKEKNRVSVKEGEPKRPIFKFGLYIYGKRVGIYAKGAQFANSYYYTSAKPKYRLTTLCAVSKNTSEREGKITRELRAKEVRVPNIIGYYEAPTEEFLFLEEVEGKDPREFLPDKKREIIMQDAEMLAKLCLAGYRKYGFHDFDDKVFDGENLHLIDVDECIDIYRGIANESYKDILMDPRDSSTLRRFRRWQRGFFKKLLKDSLYEYRDSLTSTQEDVNLYINSFFNIFGWKRPSKREITKLTSFEENYLTTERAVSMMMDTD